MTFQFLCPQGHLLQGEEAHAGQQCQCPYCGTLFVIPHPTPPTAPPPEQPAFGPPSQASPEFQVSPPAQFASPAPPEPPAFPAFHEQTAPPPSVEYAPVDQTPAIEPQEGFPGIQTDESRTPSGNAPARVEVADTGPPEVVHVICPSGHELETPREMLGQDALCPFCHVQFPLRYEDSVEYREQQAKLQTLRGQQLGRFWLRWSIVAAVLVFLGLIGMIAVAMSH